MLVLCILFGCPCVFSSQPVVPTPHFNAKGLWGARVASGRGDWAGTRETPPLFSPPAFLPPPSCSLSLVLMGVCLAVSLLYLYLAAVIL